jgi:hypothetical protein
MIRQASASVARPPRSAGGGRPLRAARMACTPVLVCKHRLYYCAGITLPKSASGEATASSTSDNFVEAAQQRPSTALL